VGRGLTHRMEASILLDKLHHYGIRDTSLSLIKNYLTDSLQYVQINDIKSSLLPITTGVPQGSILGPLLFIIYVNDISLASKIFSFINYADNTTLYASLNYLSANSYSPNEEFFNNELDKISNWLKLNRLSLNVAKTKIMIFHTPNKSTVQPKLIIDGTEIGHVSSFSLLGIIIDKHLNWSGHINHISKKISKSICILNKLKHYLPESTLRAIYNALINSHINFGTLCWGFKSSRIHKLQKKAVRIICHSKYNSHSQPLFKKLNILTVQDVLTRKLYKFYFRRFHNLLPTYFLSSNFLIKQQSTHFNNTRNKLYKSPRIKHKFAENTIRFQLPLELNKNINCITDKVSTHSEVGYSFYVKNYLINKYYEICCQTDCYICNS
jgi:hypothetical protein